MATKHNISQLESALQTLHKVVGRALEKGVDDREELLTVIPNLHTSLYRAQVLSAEQSMDKGDLIGALQMAIEAAKAFPESTEGRILIEKIMAKDPDLVRKEFGPDATIHGIYP